MKRARVRALAMVNWRGVFYRSYDFDEHVTALEGANGAGKTTVMIAAYVVLVPDMRKLSFTNLGEGDASGGDRGIFGRLGERDAPSYAALDFALPGGERLLAGVQLRRLAEPNVELNTWVVEGLPGDVQLADVLLDRDASEDRVPNLEKIRELATLRGGSFQRFSTAKDYFDHLFRQGVLPLRMSLDEERSKYHDMLQTSMRGGISRALGKGLRDFLLRADSGLGDTLRAMQENLRTCRTTRAQLQETRRLREEIEGVYRAAEAMLTASWHGVVEREHETHTKVIEGQENEGRARRELEAQSDALQAAREALVAAVEDRRVAVMELTQAQEWGQRMEVAVAARARFEALVLREALTRERLRTSESAVVEAAALEATQAQRREAADDAYERAQEGIASVTTGLADAERRKTMYERAREALERSELRLGGLSDEGSLWEARQEVTSEIDEMDAQIRVAERRLRQDEQRERDFERARAALEQISSVLQADLMAQAQAQLRRLGAADALVAGVPGLRTDLQTARRRAGPQEGLRAALAHLGRSASTAADLFGAARAAGVDLEALRAQIAEQQRELHELRADRATLESAVGDGERDVRRFRRARKSARALVTALAEHRAVPDASAPQAARGVTSPDSRDVADLPSGADPPGGGPPAGLEATRAGAPQSKAGFMRGLAALRELRTREEAGALAQDRGRSDALAGAARLRKDGGEFSAGLLRVRDAVGGTLLATQYDDLSPAEARRIEAHLGPLRGAVVVASVRDAARVVSQVAEAPRDVWLIGDDAVLPEGEAGDEDVVWATDGVALRVSRLPDRPLLGSRAREARIAELEADAADADANARRHAARASALAELLRELEADMDCVDWLDRPDPEPVLAGAIDRRDRVAEQVLTAERELEARRSETAQASRYAGDLGDLVDRADLLDLPDQAQLAAALDEQLAAALATERELARLAPVRGALAAGVDALRDPPLSPDDRSALEDVHHNRCARRDALAHELADVQFLVAHWEALEWSDAAELLAGTLALMPELRKRAEQARTERDHAKAGWLSAQRNHEAARRERDAALAGHDGCRGELTQAEQTLRATGIPDPSDGALADARQRAEAAAVELRDAEELEKAQGCEASVLEERVRNQSVALELASEQLRGVEAQWLPARSTADRLHEVLARHELLPVVQRSDAVALYAGRGSVEARKAASTAHAVLMDRVQRAGPDILTHDDADASQEQAERTVDLFLRVRAWLSRRVPPQISESDDPPTALAQFAAHLGRLDEQLAQQEKELRGKTGDIARNIQVKRRKAYSVVRKLNEHLRGVSFGSIAEIRIQHGPVQSLESLLRRLEDGTVQQTLFDGDLTIEEAMERLFQREGGGRRMGGDRLLDYREYIDLSVGVRRTGGSAWETANPTRMSTGEAIGVGAAIMMVVLTSWEQQARLFKEKRGASLRLLFLDEANRLSHDSLGELFDLCRTLHLQLFIAAPEVERAGGNTTYTLVRRVDGGQERVEVSGRTVRR